MSVLPTLNAASPLDADDGSRLAFTNDTNAEVLQRTLDNMPALFESMNSGLTFTVQLLIAGTPVDDTYELGIRIMNSSLVLAANTSGGQFQQITQQSSPYDSVDTDYGPTAFTFVDTGATKANWDGASIELEQLYTASAGNDGARFEVDIVSIDGTFKGSYGTANISTRFSMGPQRRFYPGAFHMPNPVIHSSVISIEEEQLLLLSPDTSIKDGNLASGRWRR